MHFVLITLITIIIIVSFFVLFGFDNARDRRPRTALRVDNYSTGARCGSTVGVYALAGAVYYDDGSAHKYYCIRFS